LRYLPVVHHGNQNCSPEEAMAVGALVEGILESKAMWTDRNGQQKPVPHVARRGDQAEMVR
jgi:hypothetical protein